MRAERDGRTSPASPPGDSEARVPAASAGPPVAEGASAEPSRKRRRLGPGTAGLDPRPARPGTPDLQLAGYLLAREVVGRPVPAATRELLQRANDSRKEVLRLMHHGRGNVRCDIEVTEGEGLHRLSALRGAVASQTSLGVPPSREAAYQAALAAVMGSGNCGEFSMVAAHVHAARMQPDERLAVQNIPGIDHCWVVLEGASSPGGSRPRVVLDPWAEGPPMAAADGVFTASGNPPAVTQHCIASSEAPEAHGHFEALRAHPDDDLVRQLHLMAQDYARSNPWSTTPAFEQPMPVVAPAFRNQAWQAMKHAPDTEHLRAAALAQGQAVAGMAPQADERDVQRIIDFAADLATAPVRRLTPAATSPPRATAREPGPPRTDAD